MNIFRDRYTKTQLKHLHFRRIALHIREHYNEIKYQYLISVLGIVRAALSSIVYPV